LFGFVKDLYINGLPCLYIHVITNDARCCCYACKQIAHKQLNRLRFKISVHIYIIHYKYSALSSSLFNLCIGAEQMVNAVTPHKFAGAPNRGCYNGPDAPLRHDRAALRSASPAAEYRDTQDAPQCGKPKTGVTIYRNVMVSCKS
jgi:hypothetical protein